MIDTALWRCRIGLFVHRISRRSTTDSTDAPLRLRPPSLRGCATCILLFSLLMLCGDVESNPGPFNKSTASSTSRTTRQARLSSDGSILESSTLSNPPISDLVSAIRDLTERFDTFDRKISHVEQRVVEVAQTTSALQEQVSALVSENEHLKSENSTMKSKLDSLLVKVDDLEARSRRNNAIFHGIPAESSPESWADCESLVRKTMRERLNLPETDIRIDRAHRLPSSRGPGPIIVRFTDYKDKEKVLRERTRLKNTNIYVNDDYTLRVRETRKKLTPFMTQLRDQGKRATLVYDHLVVDGERFNYDPATENIYSSRRPRPRPRESTEPNHLASASQPASTRQSAGATPRRDSR